MSIDYSDVWELGAVSDCCNAGVYLNGICAECKDHCTPVYDDNILECDVCYEMSDDYIITGNTPNVICSNCNTEERELMDVYRDVGMSPSDFI